MRGQEFQAAFSVPPLGTLMASSPIQENPAKPSPNGIVLQMQHKTKFELATHTQPRFARSGDRTRCLLTALSSPFRWRVNAGLELTEIPPLNRSYRVVSINSGGSVRREIAMVWSSRARIGEAVCRLQV